MSSSTDLEQIESRIVELVKDFVTPHADDAVAPSCKGVADAVARQAVVSSEGGKRLRALLTLDSFRTFADDAAVAADFDAVLDLACAVEVFQTGALVHDDIIDDSDLRRGKPSAHRALACGTHSDAIGHGLGIMLGDMLATSSVDIANRAARRLSHCDDVVGAFLTMHREVEIGQVLDLAVELNPLNDPEGLVDASLNVFRWKTASYTTIAPLEFGMLAAGSDAATARDHAMAIGLPLGLAFQLADDLLDVVGSSHNTGKPVGGDIREGKRTVLLADALSGANAMERAELIDIWEAPSRSEEQVRRAITLFASTGAIERSHDRIRDLWNASKSVIDTLDVSDDRKELLAMACARFVPIVA
ncbi:polyprenyl synthetase family protein [Bifidobacterium moukalabense]|uniref:polyprenyl synthetase family protein n=1 Tax=Bifidobacterium moukalabense TaxID=1333651 RepID=UPI0010F70C58|nr:polyprenyl synthetase family protein [Bifidobacterium moukalabense]